MAKLSVTDLYWEDADESLGNLSQYFLACPYEELFVRIELLHSFPFPIILISSKEKVIDKIEWYLALGDFEVERVN